MRNKKERREEEDERKRRRRKGTLRYRSRVASRPLVGLCRFHGFPGQKFDLAYQKALFVSKLVVVGTILEEFRQKFQQAIPVVDEDPLHGD